MERMLNTEQALKILKECYLTDSVQTLRKWIREGRIVVTGSQFRQGGYKIKADDLKAFIEEERPGLLEILHAYHEANNNSPIGVASLLEQQEDETFDQNATFFDTNELRVNKSDFISEGNLSEIERGIKNLHAMIGDINKTVSELIKQQEMMNNGLEKVREDTKEEKILELIQQTAQVTVKNDKKASGGTHKTKNKEEFVAFLRRDFWNADSANEKLKGKIRKVFNKETSSCYSLFYDENGVFRDEELLNENEGYEMNIEVNNQEVIIKGRNRKELMGQYFEIILFPKIKEMAVSNQKTSTVPDGEVEVELFDFETKQDGYIDYINLKLEK